MGKEIPEIIKPVVIMVEGCDVSGKGYLVHALSKKYPSICIKYTKRPLNKKKSETVEFKKYLYCVLDFINHNRKDKVIILDRFYPSELVYSKVKRGYEAFDDRNYPQMEKVIAALPHLYIYCNPGYNVLIQRLKDRGDDYIVEKDIKALMERYDRFFRQTKMNKIMLDTSMPAPIMLEIITKKLNEHKGN